VNCLCINDLVVVRFCITLTNLSVYSSFIRISLYGYRDVQYTVIIRVTTKIGLSTSPYLKSNINKVQPGKECFFKS